MDFLDHNFGVFTREDLIQKTGRSFFRQGAVFTTLHIKTLDFQLVDVLPIDLEHVDCSILLLRVEQESTEDVVDIDFQKLVTFVDGTFEVIADLEGFFDVVGVGVDHDRVSISVDDSELITFSQVLRAA